MATTFPADPFKFLENLGYEINIYQKHEIGFGNMGSLNF